MPEMMHIESVESLLAHAGQNITYLNIACARTGKWNLTVYTAESLNAVNDLNSDLLWLLKAQVLKEHSEDVVPRHCSFNLRWTDVVQSLPGSKL
jgi:cyanate lyase